MDANEHNPTTHSELILGCLLGAAVGDSLGLPMEGLSRARISRFYPELKHPSLVLGKGMFSDDTEHSLMVLNNLIRHKNDPSAFARGLAHSLKWWFLALPAATGLSTARAIVKLWLGFNPNRAGVFSAGNGAAMRSAIIGAYFYNQPKKRRTFTEYSSRLTHTDDRALEAAYIAAESAAMACSCAATPVVLDTLLREIKSDDLQTRFTTLIEYLNQKHTVQDFANAIGCDTRVTGYAPNTIAIAIYSWLRHRGNYRMIITECIRCGGDTDTVAAIAGGIAGCECKDTEIPKEWISNLCDWPRSINYIRDLSRAATNDSLKPPRLFWLVVPVRNVVFLLIVLAQGFRRLFPPY